MKNVFTKRVVKYVELKEYLKRGPVIFDGAMGTMLMERKHETFKIPEVLNIEDSSLIIDIHKRYIEAGAMIITTNTFGANELKLKETGYSVEEIIKAAINNAKKAKGTSNVLIAQDIGPIGELLEPMGTLSFERAYKIFKRQVLCAVENKADLILIETMTDLYEAKAAVLAAKECCDLPVFCTMSFEKNGRTYTGCTPTSMAVTLQGLGVDALGVNCSLGPVELIPIVDEILKVSRIPLMVQPNAGIPCVCHGKTVFNITPKEFTDCAIGFLEKGVRIFGGCCGTNAEYIKTMAETIKSAKINNNFITKENSDISYICTPTNYISLDKISIIGEKINPTGKPLFKEALESGNYDYIIREAINQVEAGADILDVNVSLPKIDEEKAMTKIIKEIQAVVSVPLQIDSSNKAVIEKALRVYNGKAIVNSVTGEDKKLNEILPIVKKYGAAVIGLTLDEKGIPETAEERFIIAEKIVQRAMDYGIDKNDVYIDTLTLTAAACQKNLMETLKALKMVKEKLGVNTVLGVSNVSYGLPNRELLNRTFLALALENGLSLPIINPCDSSMMDTIKAYKIFNNEDKGSKEYLKYFTSYKKNEEHKIKMQEKNDLKVCILKGLKEEAKETSYTLLQHKEPLKIINDEVIPALDIAGEKYERGETFLPQLLQSAETVKVSLEVIKKELKGTNTSINKGKIILATVKGDIHDIGKNIVKILLENYGFYVIDLGKDVPKDKIVETALVENIKVVGLSALMTTTVESMEDTIKALKAASNEITVIVGGAVLTEEYAKNIGADYYAKDAKDTVNIARKIFKT